MNWPTIELKRETSVITKGTTPTTLGHSFTKYGVPFIRAQNLVDGTVSVRTDPLFISPETHNLLGRSKIQPLDILISIAGTIGRAAIVPANAGEMNCNQAVAIVRPTSKIHPRFLLHWLSSREALAQVSSRKVTGVISNLSLSQIGKMEIPFPPYLEQRRIAAILDKADAIRRKREQALALADDLLKSTFLEMFGDPITNPKGWPLVPVSELGDVQGGLQVSRKRDVYGFRRPYLRVANVYRDRLELTEIKDIGLTDVEFGRTKLIEGDVLIVEGHGNPNEIGRTAVWDGSIPNCVHQNHLIRFRANRKVIKPNYFSRLMNSEGGRLQMISAGRTTSGLNTISTRKVKEAVIPLPPLDLQIRFEDGISTIGVFQDKLLNALDSSEAIFASLSQRAFRGEL